MNKVLAFLSFIFFVSSCDQSIESRVSKQKGKMGESVSKLESIEGKILESDKKTELENDKVLSNENKENSSVSVDKANGQAEHSEHGDVQLENKEKPEDIFPEKGNTSLSEKVKDHLQQKKETDTKLISQSTSVEKEPKDKAKHDKKGEQYKLNKNGTSKSSVKDDKKVEKASVLVESKKKTYATKQHKSDKQAKLEVAKDEKTVVKTPLVKVEREADESDGTYENGKLVSNFTIEELRLGAPRPLSKEEIKYFKRLCRYALMSEQEIIENGCQTKKVTFSR